MRMLWIVRSVRPEPRVNGRMSDALIITASAPRLAGAQHSATSQESLEAVISSSCPGGA